MDATSSPYLQYNAVGWPYCPACGENRLWSVLFWDGLGSKPTVTMLVAAGMICGGCGWDSRKGKAK